MNNMVKTDLVGDDGSLGSGLSAGKDDEENCEEEREEQGQE